MLRLLSAPPPRLNSGPAVPSRARSSRNTSQYPSGSSQQNKTTVVVLFVKGISVAKRHKMILITIRMHLVSCVHDSLVSLLPLPPGLVLGEDLAPGPDRGGQPACTPAPARLTQHRPTLLLGTEQSQ